MSYVSVRTTQNTLTWSGKLVMASPCYCLKESEKYETTDKEESRM
jgi:hypothetical protein